MDTPVVFIIFNRPRHTQRSFDCIRRQRPKTLFIIADGPRISHQSDFEKCQETRRIVSNIDWPCKVYQNYSDVNLGCRNRVNTGLDWVFSIADEAIIIEDDCLPNDDFFIFCSDMLRLYRHNHQVMTITGNNFQNSIQRGNSSYYFSKYNHIWGWATWRRTWHLHDKEISFWPAWRTSHAWVSHTPNPKERRHWTKIFDQMHSNLIDTWDHPLTCSIWYHNGLVITPQVNLVTNIGFGPDGTHTYARSDQDGLPSFPFTVSSHPDLIKQNVEADSYVFLNYLGGYDYYFHRWILRLPFRIYRRIKYYFGWQ